MGYCKCCECGQIFDEDDILYVDEYRGEFWGAPAYEKMAYSPCCESDFEDYEPEDEDEDFDVYSPEAREEDSISWKIAEERYIARCMEMNCEE